MVIVVPPTKRSVNLANHGIDLAEFETDFSWDDYLVLPAHPSRVGRVRQLWIGRMRGRVVAAIVSPLGREALAVIRIASKPERAAYEPQA